MTRKLAQILSISVTALSLCLPELASGELTRVTIGSNPAGTGFNIIGGGFARVIQQNLGVPSTVRPYSGSSVYLPLLQRGEITLGVNSSIDSGLSYAGQDPFPVSMTNLRALISAYSVGYMFWVRARSDLRRVEDLKGKRVVLDYRGLIGLGRLNRAILATGGLTAGDVFAVAAAGIPEGARLVIEGRVDAVPMSFQIPIVRQAHAALPGGLRFLSIGRDEAKVAELMPGSWVAAAGQTANAVGINALTRTAVYGAYLNAGTHVLPEDAYQIVKTLHERWAELRADYGVLSTTPADQIAPANNPHPYHAGAILYFKEVGLWTEAHDVNHRRFGL